MAFNANEYIKGYVKEKYDRISLRVPKGKGDVLRDCAVAHDIRNSKGHVSVSRMVLKALEETYSLDLSQQNGEE